MKTDSIFYQEALEEGRAEGCIEGEFKGKLAAVPLLLKVGMTVKQVASQLGVDIETVRQIAQQ